MIYNVLETNINNMEENENKDREQNWDNTSHEDTDNYGLPNVPYDPIERDEPIYEHREEPRERYYEYEEKKGSQVLVVLIILLLLGGIGFGVYWFMFRDAPEEVIVQENSFNLPTPEPQVIEEPIVEYVEPEPEVIKTTGALQTVGMSSGSYYVVVGSFIDDDLARDQSNRINRDGMDTYLIEPYNNNKFYRLAVGNFSSWNDAADKMEDLKSNFGHDIWVLKY